MISMTYDPRRETFRFAKRRIRFVFTVFGLRRGPKRNRPAVSGFRLATLEACRAGRREGCAGRRERGRLGSSWPQKMLRKRAFKSLKSLARANLCAIAQRRCASPAASTGQERDVLTPVNARSIRFIWSALPWPAFLGLCLDPQPLHFVEAGAVRGSAAFG
jgi:hypothetical protein